MGRLSILSCKHDKTYRFCRTCAIKQVILEQIEVIQAAEIIDRDFSFEETLDYRKVQHDEKALLTTSKAAKVRKICEEYMATGDSLRPSAW